MGASFILVALAWDLPKAMERLSVDRAVMLAGVGILIYAGIGLLSMLLGGEFLDYAELSHVLPVSPEMARYHAMLGVEIGVAFTVTAVMFAIYARYFNNRKTSIYAGSNEIQRNIMAKLVLGL